MRTTFHIYKYDCFKASRLYIQSKWDVRPVFIHKGAHVPASSYPGEAPIECQMLSAGTIIRLLWRLRGAHTMVFHAQSSLPYLLLTRILRTLLRRTEVNLVYDMHDFLEYEKQRAWNYRLRYPALRALMLRLLEFICFADRLISKLTVSEGLARHARETYGRAAPRVVRSVPLSPTVPTVLNRRDNMQTLVYFGTPDRAPYSLMQEITAKGLELHLYGRDITRNELSKRLGGEVPDSIRLFGGFEPNKLGFLSRYSFALLYKPDATDLNVVYSLPNKLFQALNAGLSLLVSENFVEMRDLFTRVPGAVEIIGNDGDLTAAMKRASLKRDEAYRNRVLDYLRQLHDDSRATYCSVTKLPDPSFVA